jgi:hypothetical protein
MKELLMMKSDEEINGRSAGHDPLRPDSQA